MLPKNNFHVSATEEFYFEDFLEAKNMKAIIAPIKLNPIRLIAQTKVTLSIVILLV